MPGSQAMNIELTAESKKIIQKMRNADIFPDVKKEMMKATAPAQTAVRRAARALPSSRKRKDVDSLRNALAGAVQRRIKIGARTISAIIILVPRGGKSNIARAVEGVIPWEHSVFGNENRKVKQEPMPFFYKTLETLIPGITARIDRALADFEKKL